MGFLKKLFGGEQDLPPADLSVLGTDFHSHLIPGIDDGSTSIQDSLILIEQLADFGYKKMITTPHIMSDFYKNTPEIVRKGLEDVRQALKEKGRTTILEAAAEYYLDFEFEAGIGEKEMLTFGDNYLLFELPFIAEPPMLNSVIWKLQSNGYKPVLAHPERYGFWHGNMDKYQEIFDKGVILQLNITSLSGHYSPQVQAVGEKLIQHGWIGALGTDCHNLNHIERVDASLRSNYLHQVLQTDLLNKKL